MGTDPLEGRKAPAFALPDQHGKRVTLASLKGKPAVLYFYPRDFTSGCTREARDFRDRWSRIEKAGAAVFGVSRDDVALHARFAAALKLPYRLLADGRGTACRAYKVWRRKSLYGRSFMGIERSTFVLDAQGVVRKVFRRVRVDGHVDEVLNALRAL